MIYLKVQLFHFCKSNIFLFFISLLFDIYSTLIKLSTEVVETISSKLTCSSPWHFQSDHPQSAECGIFDEILSSGVQEEFLCSLLSFLNTLLKISGVQVPYSARLVIIRHSKPPLLRGGGGCRMAPTDRNR